MKQCNFETIEQSYRNYIFMLHISGGLITLFYDSTEMPETICGYYLPVC